MVLLENYQYNNESAVPLWRSRSVAAPKCRRGDAMRCAALAAGEDQHPFPWNPPFRSVAVPKGRRAEGSPWRCDAIQARLISRNQNNLYRMKNFSRSAI